MALTVKDLLEAIEGLDPDTEVRLMNQDNYPFEYKVSGVVTLEEIHHAQEMNHDPHFPGDEPELFRPTVDTWSGATTDRENFVYLVEGQQMGYGTKDAWSAF